METAKIIRNGDSQSIQLPTEFHFDGDEVLIRRFGNVTMLVPKDQLSQTFIDGIHGFTEDFLPNGRESEKS